MLKATALGFAHLSTPRLPRPVPSAPPWPQQLCGDGSPLEPRHQGPEGWGTLGLAALSTTPPSEDREVLCRHVAGRSQCWPHGPVVFRRPEQRELVHHEEHGHRAGHHSHRLLHSRARYPGKAPRPAAGPCGTSCWVPQLCSHAQGAPPNAGTLTCAVRPLRRSLPPRVLPAQKDSVSPGWAWDGASGQAGSAVSPAVSYSQSAMWSTGAWAPQRPVGSCAVPGIS